MNAPQKFNCRVKGIKIATYQTNPSKKPVLLLHANSASHKSWTHQLQSHAFSDYNLIAIDFPGCGNSDYSNNPIDDYSLIGLAEIVRRVLDELAVKHHVIAGHSLGGHVALELCKRTSAVKGIMIFGAPPLRSPPNAEEAFLPYEHIGSLFEPTLSEDKASILQSDLTFRERVYPIAADLLNTDPNFRSFIGNSIRETRGISDEIEILESLEIPIAILHGKDDPLINLEYLEKVNSRNTWKGSVIIRDQCGHYPQLEEPEWFNRQLLGFLMHVGQINFW